MYRDSFVSVHCFKFLGSSLEEAGNIDPNIPRPHLFGHHIINRKSLATCYLGFNPWLSLVSDQVFGLHTTDA
jgi:hypothetical protein